MPPYRAWTFVDESEECPVKQIPSGDIEELVRQQLQKMLSDITLIMRFAEKSGMNPVDVADCFELELKNSGVKSLMEELKNE